MSINYTELRAELQGDPAHLGYAVFVNANNDEVLANLLNSMTSSDIYRNDVTLDEIKSCIVGTDFILLPLGQLVLAQVLLTTASGTVDATKAEVRSLFSAAFGNNSATTQKLAVISVRKGTRAEVLFGIGTKITINDVAVALRQIT